MDTIHILTQYYENYDVRYVEWNGHEVCRHCLEKYYTMCEDCGEYFPNVDIMTYIDKETGVCVDLCEYCHSERVTADTEAKADEQNESEVT